MARGREKNFLTKFKNSLLSEGIYAYKIPDSMSGERFMMKRPYDMVAAPSGKFMAIEAKYQSDFKAFGIKNLAEHQVESLNKVLSMGCQATVILGIFKPRVHDYLLVFPFSKLVEKGTYYKNELIEYPRTSCKKGLYDLTLFIEE